MTTPDADALLADTRAFNVELERLLATIPAVNTIPPEESRRARREGRGVFPAPVYVPEARDLEIDGPGGPISVRIIAPQDREPRGTFLHFHGGGWTLGESDGQDVRLQRLARDTGLTAVSVNYRLAPENPYPAGPDDCEAAALWLLGDEGRSAVGTAGRAAIGGDSAGGHLAASRCSVSATVTGSPARLARRCSSTEASICRCRRASGCGAIATSCCRGRSSLVRRSVPTRPRPRTAPGPRHLAAVRGPVGHAAGDLHRRDADPLIDDTLFMEARWRTAATPPSCASGPRRRTASSRSR